MVDIRRIPAALAIAVGMVYRPPRVSKLLGPFEPLGQRPGFVHPDKKGWKAAQQKREKAKRKGVALHRAHMQRSGRARRKA